VKGGSNSEVCFVKTVPKFSRRNVLIGAGATLVGGKQVMANEANISWPTPGGKKPQCLQYPGPNCDNIFALMKLRSREFKIPGPYLGKYVAEPQEIVRKFDSDAGICFFLYPSGNSVPAGLWNSRRFQAPDDELTTVRVHRWQYLDEYDQIFRIPPRSEGALHIPPIDPNPPFIDQGIPDGKGGFRRYANPRIVDHDRGIFAELTFDYNHRSEVEKIWNMFLNFEKNWRVK
jgi:hypothetical protein